LLGNFSHLLTHYHHQGFAVRGNCKINYSLQQASIGPTSVYV
jgi:hypothetical protein